MATVAAANRQGPVHTADAAHRPTVAAWGDFDIGDLIWPGERTSAGDFFASRGWDATLHEPSELYVANGFELPDVNELAEFRMMTYVSAGLKGRNR